MQEFIKRLESLQPERVREKMRAGQYSTNPEERKIAYNWLLKKEKERVEFIHKGVNIRSWIAIGTSIASTLIAIFK